MATILDRSSLLPDIPPIIASESGRDALLKYLIKQREVLISMHDETSRVINELMGFSGEASAISVLAQGGITSVNVQAALEELQAEIGAGSYSDEQAQDAVGAILLDTATIDLTYTDATPSLKADVKDGSITAAKVAADVATQAEIDAHAATFHGSNVLSYGAVGDGAADDSAEIQAAIDALEAAGHGGILFFPSGSYKIGTGLRIKESNVNLVGPDKGHQHDQSPTVDDYGARLIWDGAAGGTMLEIAPVEGASARRISGGGVRGIGFYGEGVAGIGILAKSINDVTVDVYGEDFTDAIFRLGVATTLGEARDSQHNTISVYGKQVGASSGMVLELTGDATANSSFNVFPFVYGLYKNSTAVNLLSSDNNLFVMTRLFRFGGGAAIGIVSNGGASAGLAARANRWQILEPGAGGITIKGTGAFTVASTRNIIDTYDIENAPPDPVIEAGALLLWGDFDGNQNPKPAVTGSRGSGAALTDLLTKLAAKGIIVDSTSA